MAVGHGGRLLAVTVVGSTSDHQSSTESAFNRPWRTSHSNPPAHIAEFETAIIVMRAISKLIAFYKDGTSDMREFGRWVFEVGHLPMSKDCKDWREETS
jgi:hypothetical protein